MQTNEHAENLVPIASLPTGLLKWGVAALLAAMLVGAAAMFSWPPVYGYGVACEKSEQITCTLERETSNGREIRKVALGTEVVAKVNVEPRQRGASRVFLYLNSGSPAVFAAEFEGGSAVAEADAAAVVLNRAFASATPASARVEARAPSYLRWLAWGGICLLAMFVLVIFRALFRTERRPGVSPAMTPHRE